MFSRHGLHSGTMDSGVATAAVALAVLLAFQPVRLQAQDPSELTQNPLAGAQVFGSMGCSKCHSVNGMGGHVGPDLGNISRRRSFYDLAATLWNHLPEMGRKMEELGVQRAEMKPQEAADLTAFLFTLDYFDAPGNVEGGKELFVEKRCVVCHQVGVYGGVVGPSLDHLSRFGSPIMVAAAMWNHGPSMMETMEEKGVKRPTFSGSELTDLIAYLESVGPDPLQGPLHVLPGSVEEGRVLFTEKRCIECHSVGGVGGRVGPDLAKRSAHQSLTEFAANMWNKSPAMMEAMRDRDIMVPQLGAGEMADIVAYLYSVQYFAESGESDDGRRLLERKDCLSCHSIGGRGGDSAGDLRDAKGMGSPAAVLASLWNHATLMEVDAEGSRLSWPQLTPDEMADIMASLQTISSAR